MASKETLDFETLLAPIEGENPAGADLRLEKVYSDIRKVRRGDDETDPDPDAVEKLAANALATQSKDLQLAAYLTESLVQTRGFPGLRDGFRLITMLIEQYWDNVHPLPNPEAEEGETLNGRVAPLFFLTEAGRAGLIPNRLSLAPLVPSNNGVDYSLEFYNDRQVSPMRDGEEDSEYQNRVAAGAARAKEFDDALANASTEVLQDVAEDLAACLENVAAFEATANQYFGTTVAPSTAKLRPPIEECQHLIERELRNRAPGPDPGPTPGLGGDDDKAKGAAGPIQSRDQALARLFEVAAYFRKAEPHSPISYLVERAARWGKLPFERLLPELIKDSSALDQIKDLLALSDDGSNDE